MAIFKRDEAGLGRFGEPATLILISLAGGPRHGYAIMSDVRESMGFRLGPGTLYASLAKLVRLGLIRPLPTQERSRPYELTAEGRRAAAEFLAAWTPVLELGHARLA